jgi:hypothetical protein
VIFGALFIEFVPDFAGQVSRRREWPVSPDGRSRPFAKRAERGRWPDRSGRKTARGWCGAGASDRIDPPQCGSTAFLLAAALKRIPKFPK